MKNLRKFLLAVLTAIVITAVTAVPAYAAPVVVVLLATAADPIITFNLPLPLVIGFVSGTLLPLAVGLVNRATTISPLAKGILLAVLSAVTGFFSGFSDALNAGATYDAGAALITAAVTFVGAVTLYFGIYSRETKNGNSVASAIAGK